MYGAVGILKSPQVLRRWIGEGQGMTVLDQSPASCMRRDWLRKPMWLVGMYIGLNEE